MNWPQFWLGGFLIALSLVCFVIAAFLLRDTSVFDRFFGPRRYHYTPFETKEKVLKMKYFAGDEYPIVLILHKVELARDKGPDWIRHKTTDGWSVTWQCVGGIPVSNEGKERMMMSSERIDGHLNWWIKGIVAIHKRIEQERLKNNYQTPINLLDIPQGHQLNIRQLDEWNAAEIEKFKPKENNQDG